MRPAPCGPAPWPARRPPRRAREVINKRAAQTSRLAPRAAPPRRPPFAIPQIGSGGDGGAARRGAWGQIKHSWSGRGTLRGQGKANGNGGSAAGAEAGRGGLGGVGRQRPEAETQLAAPTAPCRGHDARVTCVLCCSAGQADATGAPKGNGCTGNVQRDNRAQKIAKRKGRAGQVLRVQLPPTKKIHARLLQPGAWLTGVQAAQPAPTVISACTNHESPFWAAAGGSRPGRPPSLEAPAATTAGLADAGGGVLRAWGLEGVAGLKLKRWPKGRPGSTEQQGIGCRRPAGGRASHDRPWCLAAAPVDGALAPAPIWPEGGSVGDFRAAPRRAAAPLAWPREGWGGGATSAAIGAATVPAP